MKPYLAIAKKSFQNNLAYRADYYAGLINTLILIFVNIAIWKAIYGEDGSYDGVQLKIVLTYIVLGFLMQSFFIMDDYFIQNKITNGLISSDLLKPISFRMLVFSYNLGAAGFKILMNLIPAIFISLLFFEFLPPFSMSMFVFFILSLCLGYLVLYCLNFIVWVTAFWFYQTFSLVTIKDALIAVLSGALIPLWFMPTWLYNFIKMTPFDSIYYIPITIYLGQTPSNEILTVLLKQVLWIALLTVIGHFIWKAATKKLVVQGG
ncbi:ABC-2 family transporter protein [Ruminiclostridium herbifermentans]|uniref:ABC-2 family transporter protein n=1 Tax=Ruminiclostridium herbifermentans TaxID=2488810 RepID=A0A4U7JI57_9FIRM|nr:ABC-2 family transporter protein [Ruminiclostridium herbifermentans]